MEAFNYRDDLERKFADRRISAGEAMLMLMREEIQDSDPIELLRGKFVLRSPEKAPHAMIKADLLKRFALAAPDHLHVRVETTLRTDDWSLPEPDLAVVHGGPRDYAEQLPHAQDTVLVVEISVSTYPRDKDKAEIYGRCGAPIYWIIDVPRRCLERFTEPHPELGYARREVFRESDEIEVPGTGERWTVASLLP
ncbi:MAG: Uma2 family endonuclease [Alphaproteobacteria bacterium]|nr:Uma2 family endonuclease [Alphaproteobacteria bacterium]MCB9792162.1 Uma2 family endonuclease [Alphaproteobacteria bacterium]